MSKMVCTVIFHGQDVVAVLVVCTVASFTVYTVFM